MAGKVLVPITEHINRLNAMRLQMDIMGTETILVARTDSEAATLITSSIDYRDHMFILGSTTSGIGNLVDVMREAENQGKYGESLAKVEEEWLTKAKLKLFPDAIAEVIKASSKADKDKLLKEWQSKCVGLSIQEARDLAKKLGFETYFDWDSPRTREGYYRYQGGTKCAINRAVAFAPYCDLVWMETKKPIHSQAEEFSKGVLAKHPNKMLAYNLSPSFNW
jgi:isocitrate lyase